MEPSSPRRVSDADESDLASLISETTFPWDLSDTEDYESYERDFLAESELEESEVEKPKSRLLTLPKASTKKIFKRQTTKALVLPKVAAYTDSTVDNWCMSEVDSGTNIKIVGGEIKKTTMSKFISKITENELTDSRTISLFFTCYRAFITPLQLAGALNKRVREMEEFSMPDERESVHKGVCAFLRLWMTEWEGDFRRGGQDLADQIILLLCGPLTETSKPIVRELAKRLEEITTSSSGKAAGAVSGSASSTASVPSILPSSGSCTFMELDPKELARQLTLMDWNLYRDLGYSELVTLCWVSPNDFDRECPGMSALVQQRQHLTNIIICSIFVQQKASKRAQVIVVWIKVAQALLDIGGFDSFFTVIAALASTEFVETPEVWDAISEAKSSLWNKLVRETYSPDNNYANYRKAFASAPSPKLPSAFVFQFDVDHVSRNWPASRPVPAWLEYKAYTIVLTRKFELLRDVVQEYLKDQSTVRFPFTALQPVHNFFRTFPSIQPNEALSLKAYAPKADKPEHALLESLTSIFAKKLVFDNSKAKQK